MTCVQRVKTFLSEESGAVTVDWVVLTAALVGLAIAVMLTISSGLEDLSGDIDTQLSSRGITIPFGAVATTSTLPPPPHSG